MSEVVVFSLWSRFKWKAFDFLTNLSFGYFKSKMTAWGNKRLRSGLRIIDKPTVTLDGLEAVVGQPFLSVTLRLWSSIPAKLYPIRISGRVETKGFGKYLQWDRKGKNIYRHVIEDIEPNKNNWIFHIQPPFEILKSNVSSTWYLDFIVEFQHGMSKTFKGIKFKIRDSDAKRLIEA